MRNTQTQIWETQIWEIQNRWNTDMRNKNMRNTKQVKHKWWRSALNEKGFLVNNGGCIKGKAHHFSLELQAMSVTPCLVCYDTNTRWEIHKYWMRKTQIQEENRLIKGATQQRERPSFLIITADHAILALCVAVKFNVIWYRTFDLKCNLPKCRTVCQTMFCLVHSSTIHCSGWGSKVKSIPGLHTSRRGAINRTKEWQCWQQSVTGGALSSILQVFDPLTHNQPCLQDPKIAFFFILF